MIIVNKNEGQKIPYAVIGTLLVFNEELSLDLSKYERDFPVHLDICRNEFEMLTVGVSKKYVAEIEIPARVYEEVETGEEYPTELVPVPLDMDTVTLTLWSVEV